MFMTVKGAPVPTTRRERMRDATSQEIREVARAQLRAHGVPGISLRAIAREMGMTAPALYRYYPGLGALVAAMKRSYKDEMRAALEAARDAVPADDVGGRLVAASRAFRRWALDHSAEFALVFGAPVPGIEEPPEAASEEGADFGEVFFTLLAELWHRERFPVQADERIPQPLRERLADFVVRCGLDGYGLPLGVVRMFAGAWVRLYGLVAMEVFGHVHFMFDDGEALFEAELADLGRDLGYEVRPPETRPRG